MIATVPGFDLLLGLTLARQFLTLAGRSLRNAAEPQLAVLT